jgi:hypothetical protein
LLVFKIGGERSQGLVHFGAIAEKWSEAETLDF